MRITREQAIELLRASELREDGVLVISGVDSNSAWLHHDPKVRVDDLRELKAGDDYLLFLTDRILTRLPFVTPPSCLGYALTTIDEKLFWVGGREGLKASGLVQGVSVKIVFVDLVSGLCAILSYCLDRAKLERAARCSWEDLQSQSCPSEEVAQTKH